MMKLGLSRSSFIFLFYLCVACGAIVGYNAAYTVTCQMTSENILTDYFGKQQFVMNEMMILPDFIILPCIFFVYLMAYASARLL